MFASQGEDSANAPRLELALCLAAGIISLLWFEVLKVLTAHRAE